MNWKSAALSLLVLVLILSACSAQVPARDSGHVSALALPSSIPSVTTTPRPIPTVTPRPSFTPTSPPATITPSSTPSPIPTAVLVHQGPGAVICPILLYHHVEYPVKNSPYYVTPPEFREQMQALKDWGYTSISIELLVKAINFGADLPERPIVISFDDGDASVYTNAFPVMREMGFVGINYLVANYVGTDGFMTVDQLKELSSAGWDVGSHSMTHVSMAASNRVDWEVIQSRHSLEQMLGVPVQTFAYPFGIKTVYSAKLVKENYRAGMGLGIYTRQDPNHLFYLWRRPVDLGTDLQTFASYLPWSASP